MGTKVVWELHLLCIPVLQADGGGKHSLNALLFV